ncbi:MAG: alpha/beta hydrolase [Acidimicrobiia bacterium]
MPLHPQTVAVLEGLKALGNPPIHELDPATARANYAAMRVASTVALPEVRDLDAGGVRARLYRPPSAGGGLFVYLHGGGWVIGDLDTHDDVCRKLAVASGQTVVAVDYRLAPEHRAPAAYDDCAAATRWLHAHAGDLGCDPARVGIGGDSAGGHLATLVALRAGVPLRCQLLVYPATDLRAGAPSHGENAEGYILTAAAMRWFIDHYLGPGRDAERADPRHSPLLAADDELRRSPAALVITAQYDPLRDEGEAYAMRLAGLGVPTSLVRYPGQVHAFFSMSELLDDARSAIATSGVFIRTHLG